MRVTVAVSGVLVSEIFPLLGSCSTFISQSNIHYSNLRVDGVVKGQPKSECGGENLVIVATEMNWNQ